jgi:hypothetical protein
MTFDKRITLGNVLTIISFAIVGFMFIFTSNATALDASEKVSVLEPKVNANTVAVTRLTTVSDNRSDDIKYLTLVVKAIADAVDADIPIKDPTE